MEQSFYKSTRLRQRTVTCALVAALTACAVARAQAPPPAYDQLPLGQLGGKVIQSWSALPLTAESKEVVEMLSGTQTLDQAKLEKFFNEAVFPLFSQWQDVKITGGKTVSPFVDVPGGPYSPPKMRQAFKRDYAARANAAARERLNAVTMAKMDEIASGNFHPICRTNAMLMITGLSESDPDIAWKKAVPILLKAITSPTQIDSVRVAALAGLVRQAKGGMDPAVQPQVMAAMLPLLKLKPAAGQSSDGSDWMARRAIDVLAVMGNPGPNGAIMNALVATMDDKTASMPVRTAAAGALKIKFTPPAGFNAKPWIDSMNKLAVECYKAELNTGATQRAPIVPERLKAQLGEIRQGMVGDGSGGLLALASAQDKNAVKVIVGQVDNLIQKCNTEVPAAVPPTQYQQDNGVYVMLAPDPQAKLIEEVTKAGVDLEGAIQRGGTPAPAPAPGPGPGPAGGKATPVRDTRPVEVPFQ